MTTIKLKKNSTSGEAPSASDLAVGEVAVNTADGLLYTKHTDNSIKTIGATVIADNVVDEANLKVSNAPTNGYFLSAQSGNAGGLTWAATSGISSLVADTTPQLGGDLDGNGKNILLGFDPTPDFDADVSGSANSADALDYMKIAQGIDDNEFDHLLGVEAPWTDTTIRHEYKIIKGSSTGALREVAGTSGTDYGDLIVFGNVHSDGTNWNITTGMTIDGGDLRLIAQGEADHSTTGEASFTIDAADVVVTGTVDGRDIAANIPSSLGSAGQVLTVNSGGSAAEWGKSIAVVTALPSSPDGNTIYFVTG